MVHPSTISSEDPEFLDLRHFKDNFFFPVRWKEKLLLPGTKHEIMISMINSCSRVDFKLGSIVVWPKSIIFLNVSFYTDLRKSPKELSVLRLKYSAQTPTVILEYTTRVKETYCVYITTPLSTRQLLMRQLIVKHSFAVSSQLSSAYSTSLWREKIHYLS